MPGEREQRPATATSAESERETGAAETPDPSGVNLLDFLIGGGSATEVAAAIADRPPLLRDALIEHLHQVRGNQFAHDVEIALLREDDRDPVAPFHEGEFDLSAAESRLVMPSLDGSRAVMDMLNEVPPNKLGAVLLAFDRDGLLDKFLKPLPFGYVEALANRLSPGNGYVQSKMRPYYEGRDKSDNSVTGMLGSIPYVGGALAVVPNILTFGFAGEHDAAYRAKRQGVLTEDEYVDHSNHAGVRAAAVAGTAIVTGGATSSYMSGATAEIAGAGTAGRVASTTLNGGITGVAVGGSAQLASDAVDGHISTNDQYLHSMEMGGAFGLAGGAVGGALAETAPFMPPSWRARLDALAKRFPADGDLFEQFREAGQRHVLKVKAWRLDQMLGDGAATLANPELAMAMAGVAPDATITITAELGDDGITVMHAEKLPDAVAFGETLAPANAVEGGRQYEPGRRQQRLQDLSRDADHDGHTTPSSAAEADAGLGLEEAGLLEAPVRRVQKGDGHSGDFFDGEGADWDAKAPRSRPMLEEEIRAIARAEGRPEPRFNPSKRIKGEFMLDETMTKIRSQLRDGEGVILDTRNMTAADSDVLRRAIRDAGIDARVRFYPP